VIYRKKDQLKEKIYFCQTHLQIGNTLSLLVHYCMSDFISFYLRCNFVIQTSKTAQIFYELLLH
jgi:hypothetical protein